MTTAGVSEALKERVAIAVPLTDHLVKWSLRIPDEKDVRGEMLFLGDQACSSKECWKKIKAVTSVML
jgi:hypothetical protein